MMIRLMYASRAVNLGPMDIKDILSSSQRNNQALGITGALCLSNGIFLQCLEGERSVVNALYHRILADRRHNGTEILAYDEVVKRMFTGWSMGLIGTSKENTEMFLRYSPVAAFDPYCMSSHGLIEFFQESIASARMLA